MALKLLTPEQVRAMSLDEKDEWWLKNVYRGDMPQLTWRSIVTGMALGSVLSLTNLYIAAQTGWLLGVGLTSVILSFAIFKGMAKLKIGREMTVLENNAMQSIATSAGYMTAPLVSSLAAYTMITRRIVPMHVAILWMLCLAALGILFAFPMKKRFINDEQLPFPDGMAAGVVMHSLHESGEQEGLLKAKLLACGGLLSGLVELLRNEKIMRVALGLRAIPAYYDELLYRMGMAPALLGVRLDSLTIRFDTSIIFLATGGLTGIRTGSSMMLGAIINYAVLAPVLIQRGVIKPGEGGRIGYEEIVVWALWGGVACMTTASLYAFFSKPQAIVSALRGLFQRKVGSSVNRDVLAHIELPTRVSLLGIPVVGLVLALMGYFWFDVSITMGLVAVPLVFIFTIIAVNSTGLTSITPSAQLAQLTQLTYGVIAPGSITTNILSAGVASEVSNHASNLLMDIKPGYMLGAKPRQQAIGHFLGAVAGLLAAVPIWYYFVIGGDVSRYGSERLPVPPAITWKAVSEVLMHGLGFLHPSTQLAVLVGALLGIVFEVGKHVTRDKFPLSAVGFGLSFVIPFSGVLTIFLGSLLFWWIDRRSLGTEGPSPAVSVEAAALEAATAGAAATEVVEPPVKVPVGLDDAKVVAQGDAQGAGEKKGWFRVIAENRDTICAGIIAGGSLTGIGIMIVEVAIPGLHELHSFGPAIEVLQNTLKAAGGG